MREFKFRAWENGKMYYQVRCGGMFDGIPTAPTVWVEEAGDWLNLTGQPYTEVMQYTGLKDKNGKKVYEGDVLSLKAHQDLFVDFYNGCFVAKSTNKVQRVNWIPFALWEVLEMGYEIAGNIYENPTILDA